MTEIARVPESESPAYARLIARAGEIIRGGGLVAFPTETVYGLGGNGLDPAAVGRIFAAKGRPADNPLILHIASPADLEALVREIPAVVAQLAARFWPGPLTLVLKRRATVPAVVSAGLPTVAVRFPAHRVALDLIAAAGVPIAAPSANTSGRPSPTAAAHVLADLDGRLDLILDSGQTSVGLESTVLDLTVEPPRLLRPGGITPEQLRTVLPELILSPGENSSGRPASPGMKYRHYAPQAPLTVVTGARDRVRAALVDRMAAAAREGCRMAALVHSDNLPVLAGLGLISDLGPRGRPEIAAQRLFSLLRECDAARVEAILAEGEAEDGIGLAVMNRLAKAAGGRILEIGEGTTCTGEFC